VDTLIEVAETCLYGSAMEEKLNLTHRARAALDSGRLAMPSTWAVLPIDGVVFPERPLLLPPRLMPSRKLTAAGGVAAFFHAIAHIEFVAIYLAWDIIYRFPGLPAAFYQDWLRIADEEAQHFQLIRGYLRTLGLDYGALPAHGGLWDHARDTAHDVLARLALVPRCLEARGLDVTPGLIEKFKSMGDEAGVAILGRILSDEIGHVERGSFWFKFFCTEQGFDPEHHFQQMVGQYYLGGKPKGPFNHEIRRRAGFSKQELAWLESG